MGKDRRNRGTKAAVFIDMNQIYIQLFHSNFLLFRHKERPKPGFPGRPREIVAQGKSLVK
jgi:hypothetical protein